MPSSLSRALRPCADLRKAHAGERIARVVLQRLAIEVDGEVAVGRSAEASVVVIAHLRARGGVVVGLARVLHALKRGPIGLRGEGGSLGPPTPSWYILARALQLDGSGGQLRSSSARAPTGSLGVPSPLLRSVASMPHAGVLPPSQLLRSSGTAAALSLAMPYPAAYAMPRPPHAFATPPSQPMR